MRHLTRGRLAATLAVLTLLLAASALAAVFMGAVSLDPSAALNDPTSVDHTILYAYRIPRVLAGLLVGAILAASGAALQGLLRNALADPFILGVSGGGALGASIVGLTGAAALVAEPLGGFVGALIALLVVTSLATRDGHIRPLDMLLIGVVFNAFAGAMLMVFQALAGPQAVQRVLLRLMGSLAVDPTQGWVLPVLAGSLLLGAIPLALRLRALDLLALGDETALSLGVEPDRTRLLLFVTLSVPIGAAVAITGLVGFVGLIAPHAVRLAVGPDHRLLVPASALAGAAFLVLADGAVRMLAVPLGTELPVGVVTAAVGGPIFLFLLRQRGARR